MNSLIERLNELSISDQKKVVLYIMSQLGDIASSGIRMDSISNEAFLIWRNVLLAQDEQELDHNLKKMNDVMKIKKRHMHDLYAKIKIKSIKIHEGYECLIEDNEIIELEKKHFI